MRATKRQLVSHLKRNGLHVMEFSLVQDGAYGVEHADWNYKDLRHVEHVHQAQLDPLLYLIEDEMVGNVFLQKFLGLRFPLNTLSYQAETNTQILITTYFFFPMIVENRWESLGPARCRIHTHYCLGSPKVLAWVLPIFRLLLKRNYRGLMEGDIPMRERRALLSSWGFGFARKGSRFTYTELFDIARDNVIPPKDMSAETFALRLDTDLPVGGEQLVGRSDHLGLRVLRTQDRVLLFPRLCTHDGACMDKAKWDAKRTVCPWHGRQFPPIASLRTDGNMPQEARSLHHRITLENNLLTILPASAPVLQPAQTCY